jgi:serine/threonine-protein kinase
MGMLDTFKIKNLIEVVATSHDPASPEASQAILKLKQIGRPAIPRLIGALARGHNAATIVELLVAYLNNETLPLFCDGLAHSDTRAVAGVVKVLSASGRYDPHRLLDLFIDSRIPKTVLVQILTCHRSALDPKRLTGLLDTVGKDSRTTIFQLLDQVATEAMLPALIGRTTSEDWLIRLHITRMLGRFRTAATRDTLVTLLSDAHKNVRLAALEGLAGLQMPVDIRPICQLLRDPDLTIQSKAIETLIQINDPKAIHDLLDILQDESEYVRRAAVEVLNAIGNTSAIKDLLGALRDRDWWVRVRAADALGTIGGPKVVEAVLTLIKDPDEFIRRCAVEILNVTKDERAIGFLIGALDDSDWWVKERAVDALMNVGDSRAVPALLRMLERETESGSVAIRALAVLGDSRAIDPILGQLQRADKTVRKEALRALATLTDEEHAGVVQQAVRAMLDVADTDLRELATSTLNTITARCGERASSGVGSPMPTSATQLLHHPPSRDKHPTIRADRGSSPRGWDTSPDTSRLDTAARMDAAALEPGTVLAERYRVMRRVGKGAFGIVLLVEDQVVHEEIILKFLAPHLAADDNVIKRFIHELRYARKITHGNVIRIYDFLTFGNAYAISMEYFPSHTLASEVERGIPIEIPRALKMLRDINRGMSVAHHAQIVHRDLKPANILINDDGLAKIVDFGLAAAVSHMDSRLTKSGVVVGTPTYMAPEQVRGGSLDARTDIYSLGVIMYEILTGRPPYLGQDPLSVLYQHVEGNPTPPKTLNGAITPTLETVILKAMAVDPAQRFQNVDELQAGLDALSRLEVK